MKTGGWHPLTPDLLERLASRLASPEERQAVARHLLAGCESCRTLLRLNVWGFTGEREQAPEGAFDAALARAARDAIEEAERRSPNVLRLLSELDALPPERRELKVRNARPFASLPLVSALVERSHAARYSDTAQMVLDARLAVAAAEAAGLREGGQNELVSDHLARAWGQLGNALRVRSEVPKAEEAFARSLRHLDEGTGDPGLRAGVYEHLSSLRLARRQFAEGLQLLEDAIQIYRDLGDRSGEATVLLRLAIMRFTAGQPAQAIEPLNQSIRMLNRRQHRDLIRAGYHQLMRCFLELGRPVSAHTLWVDVEQLIKGCKGELEQLRWDWLRALIDRDMGLLDAAETRLGRVREGFLLHDLAIEAAVISLDLAEVYVRLKRVPDVVRTVSEAIPIFRSLGITRELLAALAQLTSIARDGGAALGLLRQVREQLQGAGAPGR